MRVTIRESVSLPLPPEPIFDLLSSPEGFKTFEGFGPIPPVAEVEFLEGNSREPGSEARVLNGDGSTHRERILECDPPIRYAVRIDGFSSPFRFLVDYADEAWTLTPEGSRTRLDRSFSFTLRSRLALPAMVPLAHGFFRAALRRSHRGLQAWAERQPPRSAATPEGPRPSP